jgi:hypothetical protein
MDGPVTHLDLLDGARALERAALSDDLDAVHQQLCRLRNDLARHVLSEGPELDDLSPVSRRVVLDGQERLRVLIDDVIGGTRADAPECVCLARAGDIVRSLTRQARLEVGLLTDQHSR